MKKVLLNTSERAGKAEYCSQTCKDVFEAAGVHLFVVAGVQAEPHHL